MNKVIDFPKRMDIWRKYRDEINKVSLKLSSSFASEKKLSRLVTQINAISPSILKNVFSDIELSETFSINSNLLEQYKSLNFSMNTLDANLLNQIKDAIDLAEIQASKYFLINKDGTLSTDSLQKFKAKDDRLREINTYIENTESRIQKFSKTASDDLVVLNTVLKTTKINLKNKIFPEQIDNTPIAKTIDLKVIYWLFFGFLCFALVGIIITVILLFTV